jgi:hypothetical protein
MRKYLYIFLITLFLVFFSQAASVECSASEADYRPWSGYWWPFSMGGLVNGSDYNRHPAPLEKYDYVTSSTYYGPATSYGQAHYYQPGCPHWYGMCFYWAAASILEEEPAHKGIYNGTRFNVGDKKGLLTVAYDGVLYNHYSTDSPLDFHHVLGEFIGSQRTPVIMDLGTENEIWNHPVFKYETNYTQDGNTRHYKTTIWYITDLVLPDYVGSGALSSTYYYYFVVIGGEITASGWEGGSVTNHPKNAREPYPYPYGTQGRNTGIDFDKVIRIVTTDGDAYNGNNSFENAAPLSNGRYSLILSAIWVEDPSPRWVTYSDYFKVALKAGDVLHVRVEAVDKNLGVILRSYNQERELIQETEIPGPGSGEQIVDAGTTGEYILEIVPMGQSGEPDDYEEPGYELFLRQELPYQAIFPVDPSGAWATGVALLKPDSTEGRTIISQIDRDGLIQAGYTDNSSLCYLSGLEDDFGLSRPDKGYLRVDSDNPVLGFQFITYGDYLMLGGSLVSISSASADVFFPHFDTTGGWQTYFGLINLGDQTEEILRRSYDLNGEPAASDTIELAPGQKVEADASYLGIIKTGRGCMSASTESGRDSLAGYIKFCNPSNGSKGRALVPLTMIERSPALIAPHIASDGYWWTGIAVMNTGNSDSTVAISACDKEGNQIGYLEQLLRAKQNFVRMASDIFPEVPAEDIASIKFSSGDGQPLCGLLLYGSSDELQLAGLPLLPSIVSPVYLPHLACFEPWWTGVGLMNAGDAPADVHFSLFDRDGDILGSTMRPLNPAQRLAITIKDLFEDNISQAARYLKIESPQPLSGIYLIGTNDGLRLMGDVIR